jgi:hypothetical protein
MELKDSFVGRLNGQKFFRTYKTDSYVEVPPALLITDERGDTWSLGTEYVQHHQRIEFNVIRNDISTGEFADKMIFRGGRLEIYGWYGRKIWNGRTFI